MIYSIVIFNARFSRNYDSFDITTLDYIGVTAMDNIDVTTLDADNRLMSLALATGISTVAIDILTKLPINCGYKVCCN